MGYETPPLDNDKVSPWEDIGYGKSPKPLDPETKRQRVLAAMRAEREHLERVGAIRPKNPPPIEESPLDRYPDLGYVPNHDRQIAALWEQNTDPAPSNRQADLFEDREAS